MTIAELKMLARVLDAVAEGPAQAAHMADRIRAVARDDKYYGECVAVLIEDIERIR